MNVIELIQNKGNKTALIDERRSLSFDELESEANRLANYLLSRGIGTGDAVGIALPRSVEQVVAVLAVFKLGAHYVPLNADFPATMVDHVLSDAAIKVVLSSACFPAERIAPSLLCQLDRVDWQRCSAQPPAGYSDPAAHAWTLYTSGSTGLPKGVTGTQQNILFRCQQIWRDLPWQSGEVALQNTRLSVIDSIWEVWSALGQGIPVLLPDEQKCRSLQYMVDIWQQYRVTRVCLVPSLLNELMDVFRDLGERLPRLKYWTASGEAMSPQLVTTFYRILPDAVLFNQYGLTESSADITSYDTRHLPEDWPEDRSVPVGQPFAQVEVGLFNSQGQRCSADENSGELWIAGPCLAGGYTCAFEQQRRFITPPGDTRCWMRTGDMAMLDSHGITITGRSDRQVKVRGYRVELDGIEAILSGVAGVSSNAVITYPDRHGQAMLLAFVVLTPETTAEQVKNVLQQRLQPWMCPSHLFAVAEIEKTHSGKLNRTALMQRVPELLDHNSDDDSVLLNAQQQRLADIWSQLTGHFAPRPEKNFFDAGGNSLKLMRLQLEISQQYGVELSYPQLLSHLTLDAMAQLIEITPSLTAERAPAAAETAQTAQQIWPLSLSQSAIWLHEQMMDDANPYGMLLAGEIARPVNVAKLERALLQLVTRHPVLRVSIYPDEEGIMQEIMPAEFSLIRMAFDHDAMLIDWLESWASTRIGGAFDAPFQVALLENRENSVTTLAFHIHHSVCDGEGLKILFSQLNALLNADDDKDTTPDLRYLSLTSQQQPASTLSDKTRHFFLSTVSSHTPLPFDRDADDVSFAGKEIALHYPLAKIERALQIMDITGATPFTLLMALYNLSLIRMFGVRAPLIGFATGRVPADLAESIGCYVSVLPVTLAANGATFADYLAGTVKKIWQAVECCQPSLEALLPALREDPAGAGFQGFETIVSWDDKHIENLVVDGHRLFSRHVTTHSAKYPLSLNIEATSHRVDLYFEYQTQAFFDETIHALSQHFDRLLQQVLADPDTAVAQLLTPSSIDTEKTS